MQIELRQEIANLKAQVSELRAALAENTSILKEDISKLKKPSLKSGQTYAATTATLNSRGQPNQRNGKIRQGPSVPGRAANTKTSNSVAGGGSNKVQLTTSGSESEAGSNHRTKVQVKGARKIWGTMAESTVRFVKNIITRFCNVAPGGLYVKHKDRVTAATNKSVWWYVVHADEKVLCDLESKWEPIQLQLKWKLEHCFMSKAATDPLSSSALSHEPSQSIKPQAPQAQSPLSADDTQSQSASEELTTNEVNSQAQSQVQEIESQNMDTSSKTSTQSLEKITDTEDHFLVEEVVSHAQT